MSVPVGRSLELEGIPSDAVFETWDSIFDKTLQLTGLIEEHCLSTGEHFDRMLAIPRGSYSPVNIVAREFGFTATELLHACISWYEQGSTVRNSEPKMGQMPTPEEVRGHNILIIEEVCDSGNTLTLLTDLLKLAGAGVVRTGVLHYKPGKSETGFKPDWWVSATDEWIVYPWEIHEQRGKLSVVRRRLGIAAVDPEVAS